MLFVGNSYLYYNDIPGIVQALADSAKGEKLSVAVVAGADVALIDHWNEGTARRVIAEGGMKWVVLQQGPSSVEVNRDTLRIATKLFGDEIARANARPALFSAWPTAARREATLRLNSGRTLAIDPATAALLQQAAAEATGRQ